MRKTTIDDLRSMELHDSRWLVKGFLEVFRVPGGWVYCWHWETEQNPSQIFVPEPDPWATGNDVTPDYPGDMEVGR